MVDEKTTTESTVATVYVSLSKLLGISSDVKRVHVVIKDDIPVEFSFSGNVLISSLKNIAISTFSKLFLNPRHLNSNERVTLEDLSAHSAAVQKSFTKHVAFRKRIRSKKGCSCNSCKR